MARRSFSVWDKMALCLPSSVLVCRTKDRKVRRNAKCPRDKAKAYSHGFIYWTKSGTHFLEHKTYKWQVNKLSQTASGRNWERNQNQRGTNPRRKPRPQMTNCPSTIHLMTSLTPQLSANRHNQEAFLSYWVKRNGQWSSLSASIQKLWWSLLSSLLSLRLTLRDSLLQVWKLQQVGRWKWLGHGLVILKRSSSPQMPWGHPVTTSCDPTHVSMSRG